MKMYERLIPEPVTLDDFADQFKNIIGSLSKVENRKLFVAWVIDKFRATDIKNYLEINHCSSITYYLKAHSDHMETDEIYRRKFNRL